MESITRFDCWSLSVTGIYRQLTVPSAGMLGGMSGGNESVISHTPILDSGSLPPRVRRKIGAGTVAGFVGGFFVGLIIVKAVGEQATGTTDSSLGILVFVAALGVSIFVHEL